MLTARAPRRERGRELRDDVAVVADDRHVGRVDDQRVGVAVDREDRARGPDADHVVELAARADRHEQPRRDRATGDPDLAGTREPALVGDLAGGRELGAERGGERIEQRIVGGIDALADADHDRRVGEEVEVVVTGAGPDAGARLRGVVRNDRLGRDVAARGAASAARRRAPSPSAAGSRSGSRRRADRRTPASTRRARRRRVSSSTASPVRPVPRPAATRGRDLAAPRGAGARIAHGVDVARPAGDRGGGVLLVGDARCR